MRSTRAGIKGGAAGVAKMHNDAEVLRVLDRAVTILQAEAINASELVVEIRKIVMEGSMYILEKNAEKVTPKRSARSLEAKIANGRIRQMLEAVQGKSKQLRTTVAPKDAADLLRKVATGLSTLKKQSEEHFEADSDFLALLQNACDDLLSTLQIMEQNRSALTDDQKAKGIIDRIERILLGVNKGTYSLIETHKLGELDADGIQQFTKALEQLTDPFKSTCSELETIQNLSSVSTDRLKSLNSKMKDIKSSLKLTLPKEKELINAANAMADILSTALSKVSHSSCTIS